MSGAPRRRAWSEVATGSTGHGIVVTLDGRPLRVPGGPVLVLSTRRLAQAIAVEWSDAGGGAVGGSYHPDQLVLTGLAGTQQQRTRPDHAGAIERLLGYLDGDALCYRASHPSGLVQRQGEEWQPWLDWFEQRCGARLETTEGVMPISQAGLSRQRARGLLETLDEAPLTGLAVLVPAAGSLVLGLAVALGALSAADAHRLSLLDELDQAERWGQDAEAAARHARLLCDFDAVERFIDLSRPDRSIHLLISGRVQGVGYRAWLQAEAGRAGIAGWTRNLEDGRVEALLSGPEQIVDTLIVAARTGPGFARVDDVVATVMQGMPETVDFVVEPTARHSLDQ